MKHHRVVVSRHGGPDVLQVVEEDLPEPQAGEVRVKVLAAGVSAYDLMLRRSGSIAIRIGRSSWKPPVGCGLGCCFWIRSCDFMALTKTTRAKWPSC